MASLLKIDIDTLPSFGRVVISSNKAIDQNKNKEIVI
jgi:hypothetical protein